MACLCRLLLETEVIFEARALFVCPLPALYTDLPAPCTQAFSAALFLFSFDPFPSEPRCHLQSCFLCRFCFYPVTPRVSTFLCFTFLSPPGAAQLLYLVDLSCFLFLCVICVPCLWEHSAPSHLSLASAALAPNLQGAEHRKQEVQVHREPRGAGPGLSEAAC